MDQFNTKQLISYIETNKDIKNIILSYHINLYNYINDISLDQTTTSFILDQLDQQLDYLQDEQHHFQLDQISQPIRVSIAKNYVTILHSNKSKLFDTTNKFVTIFADISKKQKSNNTSLKQLAIVILQFIYETFGHELLSFVPLLNSTILKYLKKNQESKVIISNYSLNLSKLLSIILRNGGNNEIDDSFHSKFMKFFKSIVTSDNISIQLVANLYESWGIISSYKKQDQSLYQLTNNSIVSTGLGSSHKTIRISTAKALAESIISSHFKLKDVFKIYIELYIEGTNSVKIGIVESIIQFINLKTSSDYDYVVNQFDELLSSILSIFDHERIQTSSKNSLSILSNHIDIIWEKSFKFTGESSKRLIFDKLFKNYLNLESKSNLKLISILKLVNKTLDGISTLSESDLELYQITLMKLSSSPILEVKFHTVEIIKTLSSKFPHIINDLLETSFNELANNYQQSSEKRLNYNKSHGLALILANLISLADKDYVPFELILNIWDLIVSNLKSNKGNAQNNNTVVYYTILTSWIVLTGLFNYKDEEFLQAKSNEFITIWENLDPIKPNLSLPDDLIKILEIENHSLMTLLNFLHNVNITSKTGIEFSNFLNKRKIILSTITSDSKEIENLLLTIEKRILDIHLKLVKIIGYDINSLLLIQTVKNFANLSNFEINTTKNEKIQNIDDGLNNGITSKFKGFKIDDLTIKYPKSNDNNSQDKSDYSIDTINLPKSSIESSHVKSWLSSSTWIDKLELSTLQPIPTSLINDPFISLYGNQPYSLTNSTPVSMTIAIIDSSIELFSITFPYLSTKVQLSLIENLRTFILSKNINDTTKKAISINSSIALHGALNIAHLENLKFDTSVGSSILEILRTLYEFNPSSYLLNMNSDSIGMIVARTSLSEQIPIFIKKIVEDEESISRSFSSLILASIYKYNSSHFNQIWEILIKLVSDPHPMVHSWTLDSLSTLIGKHVAMNSTKAKELITLLESFYLNDNYGAFNESSASSNLNIDIDSNRVLTQLLRHIVTSLGPGVKDLDHTSKQSLQNLIHSLIFYHNDEIINSEIIKLIQELIIYDHNAISKQTLIDLIEFNISNNLWDVIGSSLTLPIHMERGEIFPVTSSFKVLGISLDLLYQIVKTNDDKQFLSQLEHLIWITLELFPDLPLINKLITEWLDSTYDISWFLKLNDLFNCSKRKLYEKLFANFKTILNKYVTKKVEIDVNDEEAQSIAKKAEGEDEENKNNETVNWKFKSILVGKIRRLLQYTQRDSKLYDQLASKVSDLIKISFSSSTSTITELRYLGIELLGDVISIYAKAKDPIYPTMSLLEQRQAQITSALTPAFHYDSTPIISSKAINVVANFVGSKVVKINRLGRILKILTESLEDIHDSDEFKLQDVHITSARGQKRVKLAVLNAWAELKILAFANKDEDLNALVEKNLNSLIPLWAATLKEFAIIKHGEHDDDILIQDSELYEECWVNLVDVIGCIVELEEDKVDKLFNKNCFGFFYMLFAQIMHSMIGNDDDKVRKLSALSKVLSYKKLVELIYHDDIFGESIEVFERLILTGSIDEQTEVLNITSKIFLNFFDTNFTNHELEQHVDKLFELVRVNIQTILRLVPYLQHDNKRSISKVEELSYEEQLLLKKSFGIINKMLSKFPDMIKVDLYSSLLSLVVSVYQEDEKTILKNQVIPSILPILKSLLQELVDMNDIVTVNNFYQTIKPNLKITHDVSSDRNLLLTIGVLLSTSNDILRLNNEDVEFIANNLAMGLIDDNIITISTQSIKSLISKKSNLNSVILKKLLPKILQNIIQGKVIDPRVSIELIILAIKQIDSDERQIPLYTILIPTLIYINRKTPDYGSYLHKKLLSLVQLNPQVFKTVINEILTQDQRTETESLVKFEGKTGVPQATEHEQIQLKTFGV